MLNTDITIHLDHFDGPLALLLYLVQKEEMDIQDLDLTQITGQYLKFIDKMKDLNFDVAGEYLYMAATLIYLKSNRSVNEDATLKLYGDEQLQIQSKEELILKLQELQKFQKIGEGLWSLPKKGYESLTRPKLDKKFHFPTQYKEMDSGVLSNVMMDVMKRNNRKFTIIAKDKFSIKQKLKSLKDLFIKGKKYLFVDLLGKGEKQLNNLVMTFISILELARLRKLEVFQAEDVSEIHVTIKEDLSEFDINQADGFDEEDNLSVAQNDEQPIVMH